MSRSGARTSGLDDREVDAKRGAQAALDQPLDDERGRGRQQQRR